MKGLQYGLLATSLALSIALAEQGSPAQSQGVSTQSKAPFCHRVLSYQPGHR